WGRKDVTDPDENFAPPGATVQIDPSGFLGGGQVGCDFQFTPSWVFGVEGTASWGDIHGSVDESALFTAAVGFPGNTGTATFSEKTNFIASVTGRLGFAWDRWLIYGKGGVAWDHDSYRFQGGLSPTIECIVGPFFCPDNFNQTATENRTGWTL